MGPHSAGSAAEELRTAEVIGTLCLATDLGMGFPFEHGLHTTVIAMRLADRLGVDRQTAIQTYYGSLLSHAGCTTDAHLAAEVFGGSMTEHFNPLMYGSSRAMMTGLIRALPDPGASGRPARYRSRSACPGWSGSPVRRSRPTARWPGCSPSRPAPRLASPGAWRT